jgi:hypothetical protein
MAWIWTLIVTYLIGFVLVFWLNLSIGPVTPGLALLRALQWPRWVATGHPHGTTLPMD